MTEKQNSIIVKQIKQAANRILRGYTRYQIWNANLVSSGKVMDWLHKIANTTKWKLDDKLFTFIGAVCNIFKPYFKFLSSTEQKIVDKLDKNYELTKKEIEEMKKKKKERNSIIRPNDQNWKQDQGNNVAGTFTNSSKSKVNNKARKDSNLTSSDKEFHKETPFNKVNKNESFNNLWIDNSGPKSTRELFENQKGVNDMRNKNGSNDLTWYTQGGLLSSVTMPQFLIRKGTVNGFGYQKTTGEQIAIPSVMSLILTLHTGSNSEGSYSTAMDRFFANLRRVNTGSLVYNKIDVERYLLNLRTALAIDRYLKRAYGVLMKYDSLDAGLPMAYFKAMGLDFDTFRDNAPALRYYINNYSVRLHSVMAGKSALLERTAWLFDHIYKDSNDAKSQQILFALHSAPYYSYNYSTYVNVNITSFTDNSAKTGMTYSDVIAIVTTFINDILSSSLVPLISADIIKAFGQAQVDTYFMCIDENYKVSEHYNEEVLTEIQNAKIAEESLTTTILEKDGHLYEEPFLSINTMFNNTNSRGLINYIQGAPINFYKDKINLPEYACATRFTWYGSLETGAVEDKVHISQFGTEIVNSLNFVVAYNDATGIYHLASNKFDPFDLVALTSQAGVNKFVIDLSCWSKFDWMPLIVVLACNYGTGSAVGSTGGAAQELFDYNNYCILTNENEYKNIHGAVIQSLYYWPDVVREQKMVQIKPAYKS